MKEQDRWVRVREAFHAAAELPPAEREAFLARLADAELAREVASLLESDRTGFLDEDVPSALAHDGFRPGVELGPYRLVELVGRGGMGDVWRAARTDPVRQEVAIKVLRRGLDTDDLVRRFTRERQILADLAHPNIARLFDGGTTPDGRPYMVMEFVAGEAIASYCARHALDVRARLALIAKICDAADAAHVRGIVHRDLKPSNVLVDERGEPHLLDFGIAKIVERDDDDVSLLTLTGERLLTPRYAAPEQLLGQPITPATDVYAIGVITYELLTGASPYPAETSSLRELETAICEEPVTPPSRCCDRARRSQLAGDVDVIVMCALAKEPERRYYSAASLAADVRAHLDGELIRARPDTATYRMRRFVRRHRVWLAAAGLSMLALGVGLIAAMRQAARAEQNLDRMLELARAHTVGELHDRADRELWPLRAETIPALERWLADLAELETQLPALRARLAALRALGRAQAPAAELAPERDESLQQLRDGIGSARLDLAVVREQRRSGYEAAAANLAWRVDHVERTLARREREDAWNTAWTFEPDSGFSALELRWQHDQLADLVRRLEELLQDEPPHPFELGVSAVDRGSIRRRLEFARAIVARTVTAPRAVGAWERARASMAALPEYDGVELPVLEGLLPLGRDPRSGLWEFWMPLSGERPARGDDGELVVTEDSALVFVLLPGGAFTMGAQNEDPDGENYVKIWKSEEGPPHELELDPFLISKYELTQGQWLRFTGTNPATSHRAGRLVNDRFVDRRHPAQQVTWELLNRELPRFCLRLPTEAQWEYACRGGTTTAWWFGDDPAGLAATDNVSRAGASWDDGWVCHAPVGSYVPNPFGLHDVHGNVAEWCRDWAFRYRPGSARAGDGLRRSGTSGKSGINRIYRGGSYDLRWTVSGSSARHWDGAAVRMALSGVRPVFPLR